MPYTGPDDTSLPNNVKSLPKPNREKWVNTWNAAYKNAKSNSVGGKAASDEDAEKAAFAIANKTIQSMAEFAPMTTFLKRLRELLKDKVDEDIYSSIERIARSHAGGVARASNQIRTQIKAHVEEIPEEFEEALLEFYDSVEAIDKERLGRLFIEAEEFTEAPSWMPVLPKPGTHKHPTYGTVSFTAERNKEFVSNFQKKIYQEQLPVDAEHQLKLSGAVGWIKELRQNNDGSVDARVEWTERGEKLISDGGYKYVSPEFINKWVQPDTGKDFANVLIGAAITTRPFFKERFLRPLVASESGFSVADSDEEFITEEDNMTVKTEEKDEKENSTEDNESKNENRFAELTSENSELKAFKEKAEGEITTLTENIKKLQQDAQRQRFTDEVMGRSDANNNRWHGEIENHVKVLSSMSETFGEESDEVKGYITQQREFAEKLKSNELFNEKGSSIANAGGSAYSEIQTKAQELVKDGKAATVEQGFAEVISTNSELAEKYYREINGGNA